MGLNSWADYQRLPKMKFYPRKYIFASGVTAEELHRLNSRVQLSKNFEGMIASGYADNTVRGYNGLLQVFLTHSALEAFIRFSGLVDKNVNDVKKLDVLSDPMTDYGGAEVLNGCFEQDRKRLLYDFLHARVNGKLKDRLRRCESGETANVSYLSASIRHIFAHGDLSPNAAGMRSSTLYPICMSVSTFVLDFIDAEFTGKVEACYDRIRAEEAKTRKTEIESKDA